MVPALGLPPIVRRRWAGMARGSQLGGPGESGFAQGRRVRRVPRQSGARRRDHQWTRWPGHEARASHRHARSARSRRAATTTAAQTGREQLPEKREAPAVASVRRKRMTRSSKARSASSRRRWQVAVHGLWLAISRGSRSFRAGLDKQVRCKRDWRRAGGSSARPCRVSRRNRRAKIPWQSRARPCTWARAPSVL